MVGCIGCQGDVSWPISMKQGRSDNSKGMPAKSRVCQGDGGALLR